MTRSLTIYGRDAVEYPSLKADFEVAKRLANSRSRELAETKRQRDALAKENEKLRCELDLVKLELRVLNRLVNGEADLSEDSKSPHGD